MMRKLLAGACALWLLSLMGLVSCTTATPRPVTIDVPPVQSIAASSGTPQSHAVNGTFGTPLVATMTTNGSPTAGVVVTFTAPSAGASGTFADTAKNTTTATTDSSGLATSAAFAANGTAGSYTVTASVSGVLTPASFSLTNTTGAPATVLAAGGNLQSAPVANPFASPLVAIVVDSGQNPVSNAMVVFTAPSSGASGTFADTGTNTTAAITNAIGVAASATFTANGMSGADTVTATVGGVPAPASFTLTNLAGAPAAIVATSGTPQSTAILAAFSSPLVATVTDSGSNPVSGVAVTFTAPTTSGSASGTFANGTNTETDTTDVNGMATSTTFSANGVNGGPYTVTATVAGLSTPANFSLTNTAVNNTYVFYLMGQEAIGPNFYALAGAVKIDGSGNVLAGEQDYNDASQLASPEPSGDSISGGTLTVDPTTGLGTLTLNTSNPSLGVGGIETLGVQFVNSNHAQIIQFDGTATSSGSFDLQTLPGSLSGGFAFTLTGVDPTYSPVGFGGVFSITGGTTLQSGSIDTNDNGTALLGTALSGSLSKPDSLGRGTITGFSNPVMLTPIALNYYIVGPEVLRLIDVDNQATSGISTNDSAVGSAFGQGTNSSSGTNHSLGNSVFGIAGSPYLYNYAAAGMLSTSSSAGTFSGVADDNELIFGLQLPDTPISGTYSIATNGYGNLTIAPGTLGDVSVLGIYMTDPKLNLNDPNNTITGIGGGLVADMDPVSGSGAILSGGTGTLIPSDTSAPFPATYAFAAQGINSFCCEFDFVGQGSVKAGTLNGTGMLSDPFLTFFGSTTNSGVTFSGTPIADASNPGRYTMLSTNTVPNPFNVTVAGTTTPLDVVLYQASGGQFLWLNVGFTSEFLGFSQKQGSLTGLPAARVGATTRSRADSQRRHVTHAGLHRY